MKLVRIKGNLFRKYAIQLENGRFLDNEMNCNHTPWGEEYIFYCSFFSKKNAMKKARLWANKDAVKTGSNVVVLEEFNT